MEGQGAQVFGHLRLKKIRTGLRKCKAGHFPLALQDAIPYDGHTDPIAPGIRHVRGFLS